MISKPEATEALSDMERVHRQTVIGAAYSKAGNQLLFGGLIWLVGYIATGLTRPDQWASVWFPLVIIGSLGSFVIAYLSRSTKAEPSARIAYASRVLWLIGAMIAFTASIFLLFHTRELLPYLTFPALLMSLIYIIIGSWGLPRFGWIGAGMFAVMIAGLSIGQDHIAFWVAAAGGGGLIAGGLWLRRA